MSSIKKSILEQKRTDGETLVIAENDHTVSNTAFLTLYALANSGNANAKRLLSHVDPRLLHANLNAENADKIRLLNMVYHRLRYDSLNQYVLKNRYRNVMELGCGYSPRGLDLSENGIHYAGGDFASVTDGIKKMTGYHVTSEQAKNLDYCETDCTNRSQMENIAAILDGPVCMVSEGLFMYFNATQTATVFDNIRAVLEKKGGCFITQDFSTKNFVLDVAEAMYPYEGFGLLLQSTAMYIRKAGDVSTQEMKEKALAFEKTLERSGLKRRKIRLLDDDYRINVAELTSDQEQRVADVCRMQCMSEITVK